MAIPKKIHWCWLSGETLPKHLQACFDSWKRVMPDYEFILWDKNRFNIHSVKFVGDAYNNSKWAFASDFIRLYALYTEGGIYLDLDVMVFRRFDKFLNHAAFSSIEYIPKHIPLRNESNKYCGYAIQGAIIGAEKGNEWIGKIMSYYEQEMVFKMKEDKIMDVEVIPDVLARYAHFYYGFQYDIPFDKPQYLKDNIVIYPPKVFAATFGETDMNTYAIHIGDGSWAGDKQKWLAKHELKIKKWYKTLCYSNRFFNMLHWKRKNILRKHNF